MFGLPKYRSAVAAAAVLLAAAAALLSSTPSSSAPGDTPGASRADAAATARESRATGQPSDRGPVPRPVREWAAAWNAGDAERMAALFTEDAAI